MTFFAYLDQDYAGDVATTRGWGDFGRWVDTLDVATYPEMHHLRWYGWEQDLGPLQEQLAKALEEESPPKKVTSVGKGLLGILEKRSQAEVLVISDGAEGKK
jgi:hypothetical protein